MTATDLLAATLQAYRDVLGIAEIGAGDDFFALGGDSMQAMDVIEILENTTGRAIPTGLFFGCPTPGELAAAVQGDAR